MTWAGRWYRSRNGRLPHVVLRGAPVLGQALTEGRLDFPFLESDGEEVFDYQPELRFAEVRFHVVEDARFDDRLLMVA